MAVKKKAKTHVNVFTMTTHKNGKLVSTTKGKVKARTLSKAEKKKANTSPNGKAKVHYTASRSGAKAQKGSNPKQLYHPKKKTSKPKVVAKAAPAPVAKAASAPKPAAVAPVAPVVAPKPVTTGLWSDVDPMGGQHNLVGGPANGSPVVKAGTNAAKLSKVNKTAKYAKRLLKKK